MDNVSYTLNLISNEILNFRDADDNPLSSVLGGRDVQIVNKQGFGFTNAGETRFHVASAHPDSSVFNSEDRARGFKVITEQLPRNEKFNVIVIEDEALSTVENRNLIADFELIFHTQQALLRTGK